MRACALLSGARGQRRNRGEGRAAKSGGSNRSLSAVCAETAKAVPRRAGRRVALVVLSVAHAFACSDGGYTWGGTATSEPMRQPALEEARLTPVPAVLEICKVAVREATRWGLVTKEVRLRRLARPETPKWVVPEARQARK